MTKTALIVERENEEILLRDHIIDGPEVATLHLDPIMALQVAELLIQKAREIIEEMRDADE